MRLQESNLTLTGNSENLPFWYYPFLPNGFILEACKEKEPPETVENGKCKFLQSKKSVVRDT